jgi:hypothetical protein
MIEDMTVRGFTEKTRHDYIRCVKTFAAFIGRSPDTATAEDLRRFQLTRRSGVAAGHNAYLGGAFFTTSTGPTPPAHLPPTAQAANGASSRRWRG